MTPLDWHSLAHARPTAIALGNFDGVHTGHRRILKALKDEAGRRGLDPLALTFDPHPRHFLFPGLKAPLLTPFCEKEGLIRDCGVSPVTLSFNSDLSGLSAEDFVREVLLRRLRGEVFFLGPGHRFGQGARGDAGLLRAILGDGQMARVTEVPPALDETGKIISSSSIRHHLEAGQVELANRMLGRPYRLRGEVVRGAERGRRLGFPTANLRLEDERKALPAFGVYGGEASIAGRLIPAVANVGLHPTIAGLKTAGVEIHLLDWQEDLYGRELAFELWHYLRPEMTFSSLEVLRLQIKQDVDVWRERFNLWRK